MKDRPDAAARVRDGYHWLLRTLADALDADDQLDLIEARSVPDPARDSAWLVELFLLWYHRYRRSVRARRDGAEMASHAKGRLLRTLTAMLDTDDQLALHPEPVKPQRPSRR